MPPLFGAVRKEVTLDLSCDDYNHTTVLNAFAVQYSVPLALISLTNPCVVSRRQLNHPALTPPGGEVAIVAAKDSACADTAEITRSIAALYGIELERISISIPSCDRRRSLQTPSITLTITIATSGTAADGTSVSAPIADLLTAVQNVNDATLGTSLGAALGKTVTVTASSAPAQATIELTTSFICPRGKWCTAGLLVDCPIGTYNSRTGQNFATACMRCPEYSTTLKVASTTIADCICQKGFEQIILADGTSKCQCAIGQGIVNDQSCSLCALGAYKPVAGNTKVCTT